MTELADQKKALRREALARRDQLDTAYRIEGSLKIAETGSAFVSVEPGTIVSAFLPIRSEVDLRPLISDLAGRGARIGLPAIIDKTTIVFRELLRGAELVDMGFGTVGPGEEAAVLDPSIMLVPLAAFDKTGMRIGYGGGYYDRAIARLRDKGKQPQLIGIAFDCQEVDAVPGEPHDIPLQAIITESGLRSITNG
jgi:5-formyltetrahydrofolate cyclo-ligase